MGWIQKAKLVGDSIQAGSLCYFALLTSARGIENHPADVGTSIGSILGHGEREFRTFGHAVGPALHDAIVAGVKARLPGRRRDDHRTAIASRPRTNATPPAPDSAR
jgi:hypothetical protein